MARPLLALLLAAGTGCGGSGPSSLAPPPGGDGVPFRLAADEHSVAYHLFPVITDGPFEVQVTWSPASTPLRATLEGRRRPATPGGPPEPLPYDGATGPSGLTLDHSMTSDDLERGVGFRLVLRHDGPPQEIHGRILLDLPEDPEADEDFRREKVVLASGYHWPSDALDDTFESRWTPAAGQHGIISLIAAPPLSTAVALEAAGFQRQTALQNPHSYGYVAATADFTDPIASAAVVHLTPLEPEDLVAPDILVGNYARYATEWPNGTTTNHVLNGDGTLELSVRFARDVTRATAAAILASPMTLSRRPLSNHVWHVRMRPGDVVPLASVDGVQWIDAGPAPRPGELEKARARVAVDAVQESIVAADGMSIAHCGRVGTGVSIGLDEQLPVLSHPGFGCCDDTCSASDPPCQIESIAPTGETCPERVPTGGSAEHARSMAGVIAGTGAESKEFALRGAAPAAKLLRECDLVDGERAYAAIRLHSMDASNHSYPLGYDGSYGTLPALADELIQGGVEVGTPCSDPADEIEELGAVVACRVPRRLQVYSAGNNGEDPAEGSDEVGMFSLTKQLKNALLVGAWDHADDASDEHLWDDSSVGPTFDGRLKPDLVAPGEAVCTTAASTVSGCDESGYKATSGTSMAAALTSGVVAQLLDAWRCTYLDPAACCELSPACPAPSSGCCSGSGSCPTTGLDLDDAPPLPSTLRAVLVQTASDITDGGVGSSHEVRSFEPPPRPVLDIDTNDDPAVPGGGVVYFCSPGSTDQEGCGSLPALPGPDFATGYGLIHAEAAVNLLREAEEGAPGLPPVPARIVEGKVVQGEVLEFPFVVPDPPAPFRVTLAWDDPPQMMEPTTLPALKNDLDLELVRVSGGDDPLVCYPWVLDHCTVDALGAPWPPQTQSPGDPVEVVVQQVGNLAPDGIYPYTDEYIPHSVFDAGGPESCLAEDGSIAAQGAFRAVQNRKDRLNNLEQVSVPPVAAAPDGCTLAGGSWMARVIGFEVAAGTTQTFSLVGLPGTPAQDVAASCQDIGISSLDGTVGLPWILRNEGTAESPPGLDHTLALGVPGGPEVAVPDLDVTPVGALAPGAQEKRLSRVELDPSHLDAVLADHPAAERTIETLIEVGGYLAISVDAGDVLDEVDEANTVQCPLRAGIDVVLVLDRSGSMGKSVPVDGGSVTKIDQLRGSVELFLDLLRRDRGDRAAVVGFASAPGPVRDLEPVTDDFEPPETESPVAELESLVAALGAGGGTNLHDAVVEARELFEPSLPNEKVLILFSDGKATVGPDPVAAGLPATLAGIDVYAVGHGDPSSLSGAGIDAATLEALATGGGGGVHGIATSPLSLAKFFLEAASDLIDETLVHDPEQRLGLGESFSVDVPIGHAARSVRFVVLRERASASIELAVETPLGAPVRAAPERGVERRTGRSYELLSVDLPYRGVASKETSGRWRMIVRNVGRSPARVAVAAMVDSPVRARLRLGAGADVPRLGAALPVTLEIASQGSGTVTPAGGSVRHVGPVVHAANLFAAGFVTSDDVAELSAPGPPDGEGSDGPQGWMDALERALGPLELTAELATTDLRRRDGAGEQSATLPRIETPGVHRWTARVRAVHDERSVVERELGRSLLIPLAPDPARSVVRVLRDPSGEVRIVARPVGASGDLLGPGYAEAIRITALDAELPWSDEVEDLGDGRYLRALEPGVELPRRARLRVEVSGRELASVSLDLTSASPSRLDPAAGDARSRTRLRVPVAGLGAITGARLAARRPGGSGVVLEDVEVDRDVGELRATVPAGLAPGSYDLYLLRGRVVVPASSGLGYRVLGASAPAVAEAREALARAADPDAASAERRRALGRLLRSLTFLELSPEEDEGAELRRDAVREAVAALRGDARHGIDLPTVASALDAAQRVATGASAPPVAPRVGSAAPSNVPSREERPRGGRSAAWIGALAAVLLALVLRRRLGFRTHD